MKAEIKIKNYRCFNIAHPLIIPIEDGKSLGFTGVNNVGKSVPLKFFWEFRILFEYLGNHDNWVNIFQNNFEVDIGINGLKDDIEIFNNANSLDIFLEFHFSPKHDQAIKNLKIHIRRPVQGSGITFSFIVEAGSNLRNKTKFSNLNNDSLKSVYEGLPPSGQHRIPIVDYSEMIHLVSFLRRSMYVGAFRNAINHTNVPYFDLKVGTDFIKQWANWQNGFKRENQQKVIRLIKEIADLLDLKNLNINATTDSSTLNVIYDEKVYRLEELGSGVAQIIIILGNIMVLEPSLVLIDEPEMNLHPQLQVRFLALIEKYCKVVIFSSHSIGLAKSFTETVFALKKDSDGIKQKSIDSPNSCLEFAGELFYGALSDIGCRKVFLCEGQTDLKIVQHFLRELGTSNDFLLLPLYGRNQIHAVSYDYLEELKKLNIPIFTMIDSEKNSSDEEIQEMRQMFKINCEKLGIRCHILNRRAVENYFSDKAIKETFGLQSRNLKQFESLASLGSEGWNKNENWRVASKMRFNEISDTDMGLFLSEVSSN